MSGPMTILFAAAAVASHVTVTFDGTDIYGAPIPRSAIMRALRHDHCHLLGPSSYDCTNNAESESGRPQGPKIPFVHLPPK